MEEKIEQVSSKLVLVLRKVLLKKRRAEYMKRKQPEIIELKFNSLPYGGMLWWKECEDAARYIVTLGIREYENLTSGRSALYKEYKLCEVEKDRHTFYHSFSDLAQLGKYTLNDSGYTGKYFSSTAGTKNIEEKYFVYIAAEDRSGEIFAKSKVVEFEVKDIRNML